MGQVGAHDDQDEADRQRDAPECPLDFRRHEVVTQRPGFNDEVFALSREIPGEPSSQRVEKCLHLRLGDLGRQKGEAVIGTFRPIARI
jgi:hypothetical protein